MRFSRKREPIQENSMAKYELSDEAEADLFNISVYGDLNFGESQSDFYNAKIKKRLDLIASNPLLYPIVDTKNGEFRKSVVASHSVYYRIEKNKVRIIRIIGQQDF